MKVIAVRYLNHPMDPNAKNNFIYKDMNEVLPWIENEMEAVRDEGLTELQVSFSLKEMPEDEVDNLSDFEGW